MASAVLIASALPWPAEAMTAQTDTRDMTEPAKPDASAAQSRATQTGASQADPAIPAPTDVVASTPAPLHSCTPEPGDDARRLALDFAGFDQSDRGWRPYAVARCYSEAAALIGAYLHAHADLGPDYEVLLHFQAAQMLAHANRSDDAVGELDQVLDLEPHRPQPDPGWRLYVQGVRAFLKHDRSELDSAAAGLDQYARSETGEDARAKAGDQLNLNALHGLQQCFTYSYDIAYNSAECRDVDEIRRLNGLIDGSG